MGHGKPLAKTGAIAKQTAAVGNAADQSRHILKRTNLVDLIHDELHRRITDGLLPIGQRIVIDQLAVEFGTSLIPVREALARLHAERLVLHEPNKGYRIAPAPDLDEMQQLFDARLIIEVGSLEHGFDKLSGRTIKELTAINDRIAAGSYGTDFASFRSFLDLNAQFHQVIVALAGNPFIDDAYRKLGYHQRVAQTLSGRGPDDVTKIVEEHAAIIAALAARSLDEARAALRLHIRRGWRELPLRREAQGDEP